MTIAEPVDVSRLLKVTEIVMPVDFSTHCWRVLPLAQSVAKSVHADLKYLHVDTASPWRDEQAHPLRVAATPDGGTVDVHVVADADPATGIERYLSERPDAMLALTPHQRSPAADVASGHVFEAVIRRSHLPVLAAGPHFDSNAPSTVTTVIACVTGAGDASVIVPDALAWARALAVPLDVVTVDPSEPAWRERTESVVDTVVKAIQPSYSTVTGTVLVGSRPGDEIVRYANATKGSLLALATHARPMPERAVAGSVATHVVRHAANGVLLRSYPGLDPAGR